MNSMSITENRAKKRVALSGGDVREGDRRADSKLGGGSMTSSRWAIWMGGVTLGFGMALVLGSGTAAADTGSSPSAPSTSSDVGGGEEPAEIDSAPAAATSGASRTASKSPVGGSTTKVGSAPTDMVGNGREPWGTNGDIYSGVTRSDAAQQEAEADELQSDAKSTEAVQPNLDEMADNQIERLEGSRSAFEGMLDNIETPPRPVQPTPAAPAPPAPTTAEMLQRQLAALQQQQQADAAANPFLPAPAAPPPPTNLQLPQQQLADLQRQQAEDANPFLGVGPGW